MYKLLVFSSVCCPQCIILDKYIDDIVSAVENKTGIKLIEENYKDDEIPAALTEYVIDAITTLPTIVVICIDNNSVSRYRITGMKPPAQIIDGITGFVRECIYNT